MNLQSAEKCLAVIKSTDAIERERSENRARISKLINGFPPVDEARAKKLGLDIVFNGGDAQNAFRAANLQFFNAFQSRNNFFTIQIPTAPEEKRYDWELQITEFISKPMKDSMAYSHMLDEQYASVVMHGIGAQYWLSKDGWCPDFCALKDLRVATDTNTRLDNMVWNARLVRYTMGELAGRVYGKYANRGWDKALIGKLLDKIQPDNWEAADLGYTWATAPERFADLIKQNLIAYMSDAVPTINLWHFYHLDQGNPLSQKVYMKVIADDGVQGVDRKKFLFESSAPVADCWEQLIHVQFGDLNGDPPFKWHAVRSLGYMLHEPTFWLNLMRCRSFQHTWENFQMLVQSDTPPDKARSQKFELFKGWMPKEMRIVPQTERHQIDAGLLEFNMAQAKQMVGESSSAYTQALDNGTQKERTLGEFEGQMQMLNQVMAGIIGLAARNSKSSYREICRRFCNPKSIDPDAREFQRKCREAKIPKQFINHRFWVIEPDIPLGAGNQALELSQATQLMAVRGAHGPESQALILHLHDAAVTRNARLAQRLAPVGGARVTTDAQRDAEAMFGSLMACGQVRPRPGLNPIDQIDALFTSAQGVVALIEQTGNLATIPQVAGLSNVAAYLESLIGQMAADEQQRERVTAYAKALGKLNNDIKGFTQRLAEKMKKDGDASQNGQGEAQARSRAILMLAETKMKTQEAAFQQKFDHRQQQFEAKMNEQMQKAQLELEKFLAESRAEMVASGLKTGQEISQSRQKAKIVTAGE